MYIDACLYNCDNCKYCKVVTTTYSRDLFHKLG